MWQSGVKPLQTFLKGRILNCAVLRYFDDYSFLFLIFLSNNFTLFYFYSFLKIPLPITEPSEEFREPLIKKTFLCWCEKGFYAFIHTSAYIATVLTFDFSPKEK
jgi:hypothetical protein